MRAMVIIVLSGAVFWIIASCATVPKPPLGSGEVRLLRMDIPNNGTLSSNVGYLFTIHFQADDNPPIKSVCFDFSNDRKYCESVDAADVTYGPYAQVRVPLRVPTGSNRLDCYLEYLLNGEIQRTNTLSAFVIGYEVR